MPQHPGALTRSAKNVTAVDACSWSPGLHSSLAAMLHQRGLREGEKQRPLLRRQRNKTRDQQATDPPLPKGASMAGLAWFNLLGAWRTAPPN
ncbi:hypothetical protein GRJ2_002453400 [Grus japonensis]|uniref:Uncharacterized protein n=1 Tax=Grus japonensis TaxID=30415 RepID=A0ABC9XQA0_GRUJA